MSELQDGATNDDLLAIKQAVIDIERQVEGVIRAEGLLEGLPEFPIFINYWVTGTPVYSLGRGFVCVHTLNADLHLSRSVLPNDELETTPFILRTFEAFAGKITLGGLVEHCLITRYEIGGFNYGATQTYGIRFPLEIKVRHTGITVGV